MELAERITGRVADLTGEVELLRKQLADAEHELERLVIAGQVITQLIADDAAAGGEPGVAAPAWTPTPKTRSSSPAMRPPGPARRPPPSARPTRPCPLPARP